ncbi:hypothetical protein CAOG_03548 [Capsaspora owczarzaki ATCC 30864]|uniref:t-SNARE coiled-coil homology domain-containing protein n=1 Tax=Capsaspora owczarzaki (strain ATCC 30864) TaxID=595528 RepID=A0A0D2UCB1_CAPO3|nr:hypothetical protein CAOG_03548 [Capsaspora owczarzaki ATCC 30864]KJE92626.1 hypothetical protein CAOG_003548 [Capsaspora owczarzaki ATCC 30864]|eukprot:XP_004348459.1 hypothetical protein CAOG_03548 [Capsaspora owczarzaki ATCC 30864]
MQRELISQPSSYRKLCIEYSDACSLVPKERTVELGDVLFSSPCEYQLMTTKTHSSTPSNTGSSNASAGTTTTTTTTTSSSWLKGVVYVAVEGLLLAPPPNAVLASPQSQTSYDNPIADATQCVPFASVLNVEVARASVLPMSALCLCIDMLLGELGGHRSVVRFRLCYLPHLESLRLIISMLLHRDGELGNSAVVQFGDVSNALRQRIAVDLIEARRRPRHFAKRSHDGRMPKEIAALGGANSAANNSSNASARNELLSGAVQHNRYSDMHSARGKEVARILDEADGAADASLAELHRQGQVINNVNRNLDKIDGSLHSSHAILNSMKSWTWILNPLAWVGASASASVPKDAAAAAVAAQAANDKVLREALTRQLFEISVLTFSDSSQPYLPVTPATLRVSRDHLEFWRDSMPKLIPNSSIAEVRFTPVPYLIALDYRQTPQALPVAIHILSRDPQVLLAILERVAVMAGGATGAQRHAYNAAQEAQFTAQSSSKPTILAGRSGASAVQQELHQPTSFQPHVAHVHRASALGQDTSRDSTKGDWPHTQSPANGSSKQSISKSSSTDSASSNRSNGDWHRQQLQQRQEQIQAFENDLGAVSSRVGGLKQKAAIMGAELDMQNAMLDETQRKMDRVEGKLGSAQHKVHNLMK